MQITRDQHHYWYPASRDVATGPSVAPDFHPNELRDGERDSVVAVLDALRRFHQADSAMRTALRAEMGMNETDVRALRHLIAEELAGRQVSAKDLADHLGISTASTTKLLDRLSASCHLTRAQHPTDRRSFVVQATERTHDQLRRQMGAMHARMFRLTAAVPAEHRMVITSYLREMAAAIVADED